MSDHRRPTHDYRQATGKARARASRKECFAYTLGRCTNGANCPMPHDADPAQIKCCSARKAGDPGFKVPHSSRNFCLFASAAECPYAQHKDQSHLKVINGAIVRKDGQPLTPEI